MKNKILQKLMLYFSLALLLFSVIIGYSFSYLFQKHTVTMAKEDMKKRALTIADTLSGYVTGETTMGPGRGIMAYMKFLDDIAMSNVWVVKEDGTVIARDCGRKQTEVIELPKEGESVVKKAFEGFTTDSEEFSSILGTNSITVGTPILDQNNQPVAVVLLHSPLSYSEDTAMDGFRILLICMVVALMLSFGLAILLAQHFIRPLKKMENMAEKLINGDYTARTQVNQKDEVGSLANNLDELSNRLELATKEQQKLEQIRTDFISNISHELRTPVTVIRGSMEAICDGIVVEHEMVTEYQNQILQESIYLQRLVNDLLDISRLQNVEFQIEKAELNLCEVLQDVVRSMRQVAAKKGIRIDLELSEDTVRMVGDYGRLRQMIMIVLDNAIKFSPEKEEVYVILRKRENSNFITIRDHGPGIEKEDLPYIFDRFYKSSDESNKTGTGLGLAIVKQIAARHNMQIQVTSDPGRQTEFTFIID